MNETDLKSVTAQIHQAYDALAKAEYALSIASPTLAHLNLFFAISRLTDAQDRIPLPDDVG